MTNKKDDKGWVTVDKDGNHKPVNEKDTFIENGEKYTPYAVSRSYKIPLWLKACFSKWWVAGATFYFIFFGFGEVVQGEILTIILGLVLGLATDFVLNHFFRDLSSPNHDYTKYIFCGKHRKYVTLPINLAYYIFLSYIDSLLIFALEVFCKKQFGWDSDSFLFFVGAIVFATIMLGLDLIFVCIRNGIEKLIAKRKAKKSQNADGLKMADDEKNS